MHTHATCFRCGWCQWHCIPGSEGYAGQSPSIHDDLHDEERRVDFESDALVRYLDFKPTWDLAANEQIDGMRRWLQRYRIER